LNGEIFRLSHSTTFNCNDTPPLFRQIAHGERRKGIAAKVRPFARMDPLGLDISLIENSMDVVGAGKAQALAKPALLTVKDLTIF
jgi:hypothetical protein